MKRFAMTVMMVLAVAFSLASFAGAQDEKKTRIEKVADKAEAEWKDFTVALGQRLNITWTKKQGVQLFPFNQQRCWIRGNKKDLRIVLSAPEKPKEYFFRIKKDNSREKLYLGISKNF